MGNLCFGIDLGSMNLKVYCKEGDRILQMKNMVAVENKKNMIAYGDEAYAMYEKAPASIEVSYPMSYGNIGSINNLESFLKALLEKTTKGAIKGADYYHGTHIAGVINDGTNLSPVSTYFCHNTNKTAS